MKYPLYTIMIMRDHTLVSWVIMMYTRIAKGDCAGHIVRQYVEGGSPEILASIGRILTDAMLCRKNPAEFKRVIWNGDTVYTAGADPINRPDRARTYAMITGDIRAQDRLRIQAAMNDPENIHGGVIDLILVSSTGAEGLDMKNLRHIHVMEPYWTHSRILQIVARGVREPHHSLPKDERNVQPYVYLAIPPETEKLSDGSYPETTDTELYTEALRTHATNQSFLEALREVSIECMVNGESYCRVCSPNNKPLYTDDPVRDARATDPCVPAEETTVRAHQITIDSNEYFYSEDPDSLYDYKVFTYDKTINGYRALPESDPAFLQVIDAIAAVSA